MNLSPKLSPLNTPAVCKLISLALEEDLASGDVTASSAIPCDLRASADLLVKESLVLCGLELIEAIREIGRYSFEIATRFEDGDMIGVGTVIATLSGKARELLTVERTVLNFLQRMSGVASHTAEIVKQASPIIVLDTRKTVPGWRALDKYAVRVGGGKNHRLSLSDMILVKNNHIDLWNGDWEGLFNSIRANKPHYTPIQVEVRSMQELNKAVTFSPNAIMLDNFSDKDLEPALTLLTSQHPNILIEVSGGITAERLNNLKRLGVPAISMGALTNRSHNRDISLRIEPASN